MATRPRSLSMGDAMRLRSFFPHSAQPHRQLVSAERSREYVVGVSDSTRAHLHDHAEQQTPLSRPYPSLARRISSPSTKLACRVCSRVSNRRSAPIADHALCRFQLPNMSQPVPHDYRGGGNGTRHGQPGDAGSPARRHQAARLQSYVLSEGVEWRDTGCGHYFLTVCSV